MRWGDLGVHEVEEESRDTVVRFARCWCATQPRCLEPPRATSHVSLRPWQGLEVELKQCTVQRGQLTSGFLLVQGQPSGAVR
jgi:hypothetical protein